MDLGKVKMSTLLVARHLCPDGNGGMKEIKKDRRVVKNRVITTAFVNYLASSLKAAGEANWVNFKYHDSGTGTGAEAVGNETLGTPWGGARTIGTQTSSANTYTSVATTTYNTTKAITEHGLFNESSGGILMDRSKFSAINVVDGNQIEWTYTVTFTAGG